MINMTKPAFFPDFTVNAPRGIKIADPALLLFNLSAVKYCTQLEIALEDYAFQTFHKLHILVSTNNFTNIETAL
jgi:hypothetical protein